MGRPRDDSQQTGSREAADICPAPPPHRPLTTAPHAPAIYLASVYQCLDPDQADRLLAAPDEGYVYSRYSHPNGDQLADKCRELHSAERAIVTGSGMAALSTALLALLRAGDHVLVSRHLYGKSLQLLVDEASRWGLTTTVVDTCDIAATAAAITPQTKLLVAETITNPLLRVTDIASLAQACHGRGVKLLIDNTLASPVLCRPLELGADLVLESLTKSMNGHSDVLLGLLCGRAADWERVLGVVTAWGLSASPFDCWLALRGLATLAVRMERASATALSIAEWLTEQPGVSDVYYPGLASHPDHALARRQFTERLGGSMISFSLKGDRPAADAFIRAVAHDIPFCPSLGELSTTLSHPQSTSHRSLSEQQRRNLGITPGTIRLSIGIESPPHIEQALATALAAVGPGKNVKSQNEK